MKIKKIEIGRCNYEIPVFLNFFLKTQKLKIINITNESNLKWYKTLN